MRTIWNGVISFGLVSVPVGLAKAQDRQGVSFRQIHRGCGERVTMPKTCPVHGPITMDEVARGYEAADGGIYEVPDGEFDKRSIAERFKSASQHVEPHLAEFVYRRILAHPA